jgi:hypothetical protein
MMVVEMPIGRMLGYPIALPTECISRNEMSGNDKFAHTIKYVGSSRNAGLPFWAILIGEKFPRRRKHLNFIQGEAPFFWGSAL